MHIVVVCGTNRDGALSRLLAQETAEIYRQRDHSVDLLDMQELPPEVLQPTAYKEQPENVAALVQRFLKSLRAVEHFQQVAGYRNAYIFPRRLFIGDSFKQFIDGKLADDALTDRLRMQADGFLEFIGNVKA
jgi:NAD(P)H-dependent FMN reductase